MVILTPGATTSVASYFGEFFSERMRYYGLSCTKKAVPKTYKALINPIKSKMLECLATHETKNKNTAGVNFFYVFHIGAAAKQYVTANNIIEAMQKAVNFLNIGQMAQHYAATLGASDSVLDHIPIIAREILALMEARVVVHSTSPFSDAPAKRHEQVAY
jgi:hypothetical protein